MMNSILKFVLDRVKNKVDADCVDGNIGKSERVLSVLSGGLMIGMGVKKLTKNPLTALSVLSFGGALVYRGVTGNCTVKRVVDGLSNTEEVTVIEHRYFVK